MNENESTELKTIAFANGMRQGMVVTLTNVMNYIEKKGFKNTAVGDMIFRHCKYEKEEIEKTDPTGRKEV